ncbi:hypothetical protein ACN6KS_22460 [Paenibacillus nitricinens]|uniref:hypothetical protein n=1 Tax=Paenibacillus nitricinens TaxID=3367691 RepID=UPI003F83607D
MLNRIILLILSSISLFLTVSCSQEASIDIGDAVDKSEKYFRQLDEIGTTASSYDGKKDLKFRLMVEGNPTETEATNFFNRILDVIAKYSNHSDVWDFYNGYFDITNYDQGVIYEGTKLIGEELKVQTK